MAIDAQSLLDKVTKGQATEVDVADWASCANVFEAALLAPGCPELLLTRGLEFLLRGIQRRTANGTLFVPPRDAIVRIAEVERPNVSEGVRQEWLLHAAFLTAGAPSFDDEKARALLARSDALHPKKALPKYKNPFEESAKTRKLRAAIEDGSRERAASEKIEALRRTPGGPVSEEILARMGKPASKILLRGRDPHGTWYVGLDGCLVRWVGTQFDVLASADTWPPAETVDCSRSSRVIFGKKKVLVEVLQCGPYLLWTHSTNEEQGTWTESFVTVAEGVEAAVGLMETFRRGKFQEGPLLTAGEVSRTYRASVETEANHLGEVRQIPTAGGAVLLTLSPDASMNDEFHAWEVDARRRGQIFLMNLNRSPNPGPTPA